VARIVLELTVGAPATAVVEALDTQQGIAGWWTGDVDFPGGEGSTMTLGFPAAPKPFHLRVDGVDDQRVRWTSIGDFPPHWSDTTITWTLTPSDGATLVHFNHDGWANDEGQFPTAAMTWGQLMTSLKQYVETGEGTPLYRKD